MTTTPFRLPIGWPLTAMLMMLTQLPTIASASSPPPPPPPTLAEKVKRSERIVVAKVGRLQYMRWKSPSDPLELWDVSDTPLAGYSLYMNLVDSQVLYEEAPTNQAERDNERPDLPLWVGAYCFGFGKVGDHYQHFPPPAGESRVFFLSRKLLGSDKKIHSSMCEFPALPVTEVADIKHLLLRESPFKSKLMDVCLRAGKSVISASDTQVVCGDGP